MSSVIKIRQITRDFFLGQEVVKVLKGIDLEIEKGEYVAFMGPSGSGKSTLMNLLGCLDTPTSGQYILNG
ncbi:ATP-binding cassette domain-containing protein, partial [Salinimicrobium oceani]